MSNGLEALERIKEFCKVINQEKFMKEKKVEYCYLKPHIDYLNIIEKDLEILEIFKNCFVIINDELMFSISPKQEEKVKRWLEK